MAWENLALCSRQLRDPMREGKGRHMASWKSFAANALLPSALRASAVAILKRIFKE